MGVTIDDISPDPDQRIAASLKKIENLLVDLINASGNQSAKPTPIKYTEQGRNKIIQIAKEKLGCLAYDDCYDVNFITLFFPSDTFLVFGYVEQFCKLANTRLHRIAVREGGLDLEFELL